MALDFFNILKEKMDEFAHLVYKLTKAFPKEEMYGSTSQLRRASLSIILNYTEGYARMRPAVKLNFWETSYGSLKESKYLLYFAYKENWIETNDYTRANAISDEIGKMLWSALKSHNKNV
jgi:four helix bundle protein